MRRIIVLILVSVVFFAGCASLTKRSAKLRTLELGMSKTDVLRRLGNPSAVKGSFRNNSNQAIDVWEYDLYSPRDFSGSYPERYWIIFADGALVKFDLAGDWRKEEKLLIKTEFK